VIVSTGNHKFNVTDAILPPAKAAGWLIEKGDVAHRPRSGRPRLRAADGARRAGGEEWGVAGERARDV